MIIAFCGHSSYIYKEKHQKMVLELLEKLSNGKELIFYLGGYGAFDEFAKTCSKVYKRSYPTSKLVFITPYLGKWLEDRKEYLEDEYDEIIFPPIESVPRQFAILKRNEWIVDQADYVIGYVGVSFGGAYQALSYAKKRKKPYTNLYE